MTTSVEPSVSGEALERPLIPPTAGGWSSQGPETREEGLTDTRSAGVFTSRFPAPELQQQMPGLTREPCVGIADGTQVHPSSFVLHYTVGIKPRTSNTLDKCSTTEPAPSALLGLNGAHRTAPVWQARG